MADSKQQSERFVAKLLFQFRVVAGGVSNKRRTCEERMVIFTSATAKAALLAAKRYGLAAQHNYKNNAGNKVFFEFVGVQDLLHLGVECDPEEVWYDIVERVEPMERRRKLIPPEAKLNAISGSAGA